MDQKELEQILRVLFNLKVIFYSMRLSEMILTQKS